MKKELGGVAPFSGVLWWDGSSSSVTDVGQLDPGQKLKRLSHPHASDLSGRTPATPRSFEMEATVLIWSSCGCCDFLRTPWRDVSYKPKIYYFLCTSQPHSRQPAKPVFPTSIRFFGGSASILQNEVADNWGRRPFLCVDNSLRREREFNETTCFTINPTFDLQTSAELQECQLGTHHQPREELPQRADQCGD